MFFAIKKLIIVFLLGVMVLISSSRTATAFDYEFYFFGINLKTYQNSNWVMVTAGALTSIICHEFGHAFYLDSQGKDWSIHPSSAGLTIETGDYLTDGQYRDFGWSGFAFQSFLGTILTSFDTTRKSDFTKGFVSVTAAQLVSYEHRGHDHGDDFALIERGNGDRDPNNGMLAIINHNNLVAIANLDQKPSPMEINKLRNIQLADVHSIPLLAEPASEKQELHSSLYIDPSMTVQN